MRWVFQVEDYLMFAAVVSLLAESVWPDTKSLFGLGVLYSICRHQHQNRGGRRKQFIQAWRI